MLKVVLIESTANYEALQSKVVVFLLKEMGDKSHQDLFGTKNVNLISNSKDIIEKLSEKYKNEELIFFKNLKK